MKTVKYEFFFVGGRILTYTVPQDIDKINLRQLQPDSFLILNDTYINMRHVFSIHRTVEEGGNNDQ